MSQNKKEAPPKDRALIRLAPSVAFDELEHKVDIKAFFKFYLVLFLHFTHNTHQV